MTKTTMSAGFAKFASKTTKGKYDEARKGERMGRGIPFPVGTEGTAVVGSVVADETKPDPKTGETFPRIRVDLKVETPEEARGKSLSGSGLMQVIKAGNDPSKWSEEDAFSAALGLLEDLGLPEEISKGYKDFQECLDWFTAEPRVVHWEVQANNYTNRQGQEVKGKQIRAYAIIDEASIPSADDTPSEPLPGNDPDATYCTYRGGKHLILKEDGDTLTIKGLKSGNERTVNRDDVEILD